MTSKRVLLLGMVYTNSNEGENPSCGQEFRDRARCKSMETMGYKVYTLDDKHDSSEAEFNRHCKTNFCDIRRMMQWIEKVWGGSALTEGDEDVPSTLWDNEFDFDSIILDYFFSPAGWTEIRWKETFFTETIPTWAENGLLTQSGTVWLPNLRHVDQMLKKHRKRLDKYFVVHKIRNPMLNPLYAATEVDECNEQLLRCKEKVLNATQLPYLLSYSEFPFYCLERISVSTMESSKPAKKSTKKQRVVLKKEEVLM